MLDLFAGGGGAAVGYHRAGFDVIGVDINPQPDYPFEFHQGNALHVIPWGFDAVHASPPCQAFTRAKHLRDAQGGTCSALDLIYPTREKLRAWGMPYVIENVPGTPLIDPITLCGSSFGLKVRRHRAFECHGFLPLSQPCKHSEQGKPVGVYHVLGDEIPQGGHTAKTLEEAQAVMGIDWLPWKSLKESIPPAFTEYLGGFLMSAVKARV